MKKLQQFLVLVLAIFTVTACSSDNKYNDTATDYQLIAYKVEDTSGQYAYVVGTMHVGKKEDYPFRQEIEAAFDESDYLAVEANIAAPSNASLATDKNAIKDMNVSESALEHFKEVIDTYPETFNKVEMSYDHLINYHGYAIDSLTSLAAFSESGLSSIYGIDYYFLDRAKETEKEIIEMEGMAFQFNLLQQANEQYTDVILQNLLSYNDNIALLKKMHNYILNGEVEVLEKEMYPENQTEAEKKHSDLIIHHRNDRMTDLVEEYLTSGDVYFVAVGAGHVVGETGIANQLIQKGYTVTRL